MLSSSLHFTRTQFFDSHAHSQRVHAAATSPHCILKNGRGNEIQLYCLRFLRSIRQVDCACKNRQLSGLCLLIKCLIEGSPEERGLLAVPAETLGHMDNRHGKSDFYYPRTSFYRLKNKLTRDLPPYCSATSREE